MDRFDLGCCNSLNNDFCRNPISGSTCLFGYCIDLFQTKGEHISKSWFYKLLLGKIGDDWFFSCGRTFYSIIFYNCSSNGKPD